MPIRNWSLSVKLGALICSLLLFLLLTELNSLRVLKNELLTSKKAQVKEQVESAYSLIDHYYQQSNTLGEAEAKKRALEAVSALRYSKNGYFWVNDMQHALLMHPIKKKIIGKNMANSQDADGKYHWREMVTTVKADGEGFVEYRYKGPQFKEPKDKVSYVKGLDAWGWIVGSGIYLSDVQELYNQILIKSLLIFAFLMTFAALGSWLIIRDITQPLDAMLASVKRIASGDLTESIHFNRRDEIGQLGDQISNMTYSLREILLRVDRSASSLKSRTEEMQANTENTCGEMDKQFSEVNLLATAMEEMSCTIKEVAGNAQTTSAATQDATSQTESSKMDVIHSVDSIRDLASSVASATDVMNQLNQHTNKIGDVVSVIREISEQTNLLALNAAIEAARAGEAGRGFAVVADEVRSLASRTQVSTVEIEEIIQQLQSIAADASHSMNQSQAQAQANAELVEKTGNNISNIVEHINCVNDMSNQIASAAEQQSSVASEISSSLIDIRGISENVVTHAHEINHNSEEVNALANELSRRIANFKLT